MALSIDTFTYFSHDSDMRNDIKIKALRRNFGATGYAVWCFVLESLTDKENFEIEYTDIEQELMAADFDISVNELRDIIDYCIKINLLQLEDGRLFSKRHKERLYGVIEKKERKSTIAKQAIASRWNKQEADTNNSYNTDEIQTNNECSTDVIQPIYESIPKENRRDKKRLEEMRKDENRVRYPYQEIADKWNSVCGDKLPKVVKLSEARKQKIRMRLIEFGKEEAWIPTIDTLFKKIVDSDFLRGDNNHQWVATFDWLFDSPKNWVKVLEGNYDNHRGGKSAAQQANTSLGVGEYIDDTGRRTYGSGRATIPNDAPPRPSESYCWNESTKQWIIL